MKNLILIIGLFMSTISFAQSKTDTISFKTSAICDDCKERIETELNFTKGVVKCELSLDTKEVEVIYKKTKTTPLEIQKAINNAGYDANESPANEKAYNKLPACCQKGGHDNME